MEKFTPLATNFTLPPALTGWTNSTSAYKELALSLRNMCFTPFKMNKERANKGRSVKSTQFL